MVDAKAIFDEVTRMAQLRAAVKDQMALSVGPKTCMCDRPWPEDFCCLKCGHDLPPLHEDWDPID